MSRNQVKLRVVEHPDRLHSDWAGHFSVTEGKRRQLLITVVPDSEWLVTSRCFCLFVIKLLFTNVLLSIIELIAVVQNSFQFSQLSNLLTT